MRLKQSISTSPAILQLLNVIIPIQFVKIQRILAEVRRRPGSVDTLLRTEFQARNIKYTDLVMTSNPPKKRLEFTLGDTAYVKVTATGAYSVP